MRGSDITLATLLARFDASRALFLERRTEVGGFAADVAQARATIYADCVRAAEHAPGLFKLTVPTGGGKTLSGMAFALRHAVRHGLHRVIVAVPFITITEQTAGMYRETFADDARLDAPAVLEHHSAADAGPDADDERSGAASPRKTGTHQSS
jgi:CRISPR-associated endonuclease/helicase Cas3